MQPTTTAIARFLRQHATPAEQHLWRHLRDYQLSDHYFRRQYPIGRFIVDFACRKSRLVIEVDGSYHENQIAEDLERARYLGAQGFTVLRFTNDEVLHRTAVVLATIRQQLTLTPAPLPLGEGARGKVVRTGWRLPKAPPLPKGGEGVRSATSRAANPGWLSKWMATITKISWSLTSSEPTTFVDRASP